MGKIIQFENSATNIDLALREQIKHVDICIDDEFVVGDERVFVSGIAFRPGSIRKGPAKNVQIAWREPGTTNTTYLYFPGHKVECIVPTIVSLSTLAQLQAAGDKFPASQPLQLDLVFELHLDMTDTSLDLVINAPDIQGLPPVPSLQNLQQRFSTRVAARRIPIDVGAITGLGGKPEVVNVGIAVTSDAGPGASDEDGVFAISDTVVGIRIELGGPPTNTSDWESFLAGGTTLMADNEGIPFSSVGAWLLFSDAYFVTEAATRSVEEGLASSSQFRLQGGITSSWAAPDGNAIVNLDFFGTVIDVCNLGLLGKYDIDVRVQLPVELSVVGATVEHGKLHQGKLQQKTKFNYWKSDWDTGVCMVEMTTLMWPYIGGLLMEEKKLGLLDYIVSILVQPLPSIAFLLEANKGGRLPPPPECAKIADDEFLCSQEPFDVGPVAGEGIMALESRRGLPAGLEIMGRSFWRERLARMFSITSIDVHQFRIATPHFSCPMIGSSGLAALLDHPEDVVLYESTVSVNFQADGWPGNSRASYSLTDLIPPFICNAHVRPEDDPLNVFAPYVSWDTARTKAHPQACLIYLRVPVTKVNPAYFSEGQRYPCQLLIQTSVGTRMVILPPIEKAAGDDMRALVLEVWARRSSDCYAKSQAYNPGWSIDPADVGKIGERHLWQVLLAGLSPEEQVALKDTRANQVVAVAKADARGMARLDTFLAPTMYGGQLRLERSVSPINPEGTALRDEDDFLRVDGKQMQFLLESEIANGEPVGPIAATVRGGRQMLVVVQPSGPRVYDLSDPRRVRLLGQCPLRDLTGATIIGSRILVCGNEGSFSLEIDSESGNVTAEQVSNAPTLAIGGDERQIFVLSGGRVEIWNKSWQRVQRFDSPAGARFLAASMKYLLIGSDNQVDVYRLAAHEVPSHTGSHEFAALSGIYPALLNRSDDHFVLRGSTRSELIDVSDPAKLMILRDDSTFFELAHIQRYRDLLIDVDKDGKSLRIYSVGKTALV